VRPRFPGRWGGGLWAPNCSGNPGVKTLVETLVKTLVESLVNKWAWVINPLFNRALMLKSARYHPMEKPGAQTQLAQILPGTRKHEN